MGITHLHNIGTTVFVLILAACTTVTLGQFNHKKPWPTYSLQNMPQTGFTCHDKILGGYYADPEAQCQMFHVCVKVAGVGVQDFRFLCPNGTAFDQEVQICANWGDVDCEEAVLYYGSDNFDLYRLGSGFESKRAPLAEEEESTFHLQRAETGDIRRSKETQVDQKLRPESLAYTKKYDSTTRNSFYERNSDNRKSNYDQNNDFNKVTSKSDNHLKKTTSSYYTTPRGNDINNNADSKQDGDDLFKGSHSSNFFSNRNGGREDDFYDSKPAGSTTTSTSRPHNPSNQYYNGNNGAQNDYNDFNKIPNDTTKRPHRSRRPIQNNPTSPSSIPTSPPSTTTFATTKRLTLQTSYNTAFNSENNQPFRPTSPSTSTTSTTTTQRTTSKFEFASNDFQQNIQPTTYNPTGAFRYKATTSKYDDISETALRGERPGQSTLLNSQYESQSFDVFNKVSNRKAANSERNFEKQQSKNSTFANRNEFTDYIKTKNPSGFQTSSPRTNQPQNNTPQGPINLNVQPLDPSKVNSELRHFNQTQPNNRGRTPNSRLNEQTEPQYFRSRTLETPAPFAVPQAKPQSDNNFAGSPQREFTRVEPLQKPKTFDGKANGYLPLNGASKPVPDRSSSDFAGLNPPQKEPSRVRNSNDQSVGTTVDRDSSPRLQSKQQQSNFNGNQNPQTGRLRPEQRTGLVEKLDSFPQPQVPNQIEVNLNGYNSPQQEVSRIRPRVRTGSPSSKNVTPNSFQQGDSSSTTSQQTEPTPKRGRGRINYKSTTQQQTGFPDNFVQSTTSGLKKFSTLVPKDQYHPTTFKPTTYKKAFEQKPTKHIDPKQRGTPYTTTTTPLPSSISQSVNTPDEDDGQYHPELYEVDDSKNYDLPSKKPSHSASFANTTPQQRPQTSHNTQTTRSPQAHLQTQQQTAFHKQSHQPPNNYQSPQKEKHQTAIPTDLSDEEELFKTAHSLNLGAASINKLRADTLKTPDKTPLQSSPNFAFDRSTYPTTTPSTTTWRPTSSFVASSSTSTRTPSPSKKPKKSSASKRPPHADADTSYDYAYYDSLSETPQEYSEYDVISEFRKTKKN